MTTAIETAVTELERLALSIKNGWSADATFLETWGWNCAALTRHDLSNHVLAVAASISSISADKMDKPLNDLLTVIPVRVQLYISQTLPQMWGGNNPTCVSLLEAFLEFIMVGTRPYLEVKTDWTALESQHLLPKALAARLRSMESSLATLAKRSVGLDDKVTVIESAYTAAESLPTDLQTLAEARDQVEASRKEVDKNRLLIDVMKDLIEQSVERVKLAETEASQLVRNCEEAYSAATTKGLGEAFSIKAKELSTSMWIWVGLLTISLVVGAFVGHDRIASLDAAINSARPSTAAIFANLIVDALSVAAPVWFAWIATKQLGQRFRLAEDYGYKASIAKAYEGYRREAARLDPQFAARLFSTALTRIEEAPLRLVENETHGSPFHELTDKFKQIRLKGGGLEIAASKAADVEVMPASATLVTSSSE